MRLRKVKNALEKVNSSKYIIINPKEYKGKFKKIFNNDNPICLEIGTGKGNFIKSMALNHPNINYIGMEKSESVLVRAVEKVEELEINNLRFILGDAKELRDIFNKEIDTIYLNFSDPWPKNRHSKRRLTSEVFLELYEDIFKSDKHIVMKTDNILLFGYSLSSLSLYGYKLKKVSLDLHSEDIENYMTEYEEKFSNMGYKINYVDAYKEK